MLLPELSIVPLESVPAPPYKTPDHDLLLIYSTAKRMESLCAKLKGLGLASAQVGLPWRMFVVNPFGDDFQCYFDCEYEPITEEKHTSIEGCLSLPGQQYAVQRYAVQRYEAVRVSGMRMLAGDDRPESQSFSREFYGTTAVLMQHEIDHDKGRARMIDVIGTKVFPAWR